MQIESMTPLGPKQSKPVPLCKPMSAYSLPILLPIHYQSTRGTCSDPATQKPYFISEQEQSDAQGVRSLQ